MENKQSYVVGETAVEYLGGFEGSDIYIKRDDLIGFSFGGNKVRIAAEIFGEILKQGYTSVVSYGSYTSNLNRVIAHFACYYGIKVYIVCKEEENVERGANMCMAEHTGAEYIFCNPGNVAEAVDKALNISKSRGEKPFYVYGSVDGSGNEEILMRGYRRAYEEIRAHEERSGISFDRIYLACGTGMTQSGLLAGRLEHGGREAVIGISVARDSERAEAVIERNLGLCGYSVGEAADEYGSKPEDKLICVKDAYLCGGYGQYDSEISGTVMELVTKCGIALDPVYSGKAFYGMLEEIKKEKPEGNILFIHTGGTAGFFDFLNLNLRREKR